MWPSSWNKLNQNISADSSNSQSHDNLIIIVKRSAVEKRAANMRQKYQCNSTFCEKRLQLNAKYFRILGCHCTYLGEMRFQFFQEIIDEIVRTISYGDDIRIRIDIIIITKFLRSLLSAPMQGAQNRFFL